MAARMNRRSILIAVSVVATLIAVWLVIVWIQSRAARLYSGTVETREIQIGSKIGGRVLAVPVEEGQRVPAGSLLVRFECDELNAQRAQAAAAVNEAQADLDRMTRGNRPEEIQQAEATAHAEAAAFEEAKNGPRIEELHQAQADYAAAQADSVDAEAYFHRMEKLIAGDIVSRQQFDDARDKRDAARERTESARQHLALLQAGTRPEDLHAAEARFHQAEAAAVLSRKGFRREDIDAARGRLAQAQGRVAELDARLLEAELTAPSDAIIEIVSVRPGDLVPANQIVVTMQEASQLWVKVWVPETRLSRIRLGQHADVRIEGFSQHFSGSVQQIASQGEFLPRNVQTTDDREHLVFGVKVHVDNPDGILKSGMTAAVHFE
jgi:multidrug resistance efflux pump